MADKSMVEDTTEAEFRAINFTENEETILQLMFQNFENILEAITKSPLYGYCEFTSNDLYELAIKLGIEYW